MRNILLLCVFCLSLNGCTLFQPPRPLAFEEQEAWMAKRQCMREATNMNPEWPGSSNPYWTDYFLMCMESMGISRAAINRMWW